MCHCLHDVLTPLSPFVWDYPAVAAWVAQMQALLEESTDSLVRSMDALSQPSASPTAPLLSPSTALVPTVCATRPVFTGVSPASPSNSPPPPLSVAQAIPLCTGLLGGSAVARLCPSTMLAIRRWAILGGEEEIGAYAPTISI